MAVDSSAALAAEQDAVARFFENLQKQAEQEPENNAVTKAVVQLLNVAVVPVTGANRETWECRMCGGRDEKHTNACVVPALKEWVNPSQR
jgi:hypothetical protein